MSKLCNKCGAELEDNAVFCDECGAKIEPEENKDIKVEEEIKKDNASIKKEMNPIKNSGLGIAGFIFGILSLLSCGAFYIPEILGIVFSSLALKDKNSKHGLPIAGMIFSIIGALICAILILYGISSGAA